MRPDAPLVLHPSAVEFTHDPPDGRGRGWQLFLIVMAVTAFLGAVLIVSVLVVPSAGAAGGCGGG